MFTHYPKKLTDLPSEIMDLDRSLPFAEFWLLKSSFDDK
jgi:hypothetical protein